jgi:hypothetical protein
VLLLTLGLGEIASDFFIDKGLTTGGLSLFHQSDNTLNLPPLLLLSIQAFFHLGIKDFTLFTKLLTLLTDTHNAFANSHTNLGLVSNNHHIVAGLSIDARYHQPTHIHSHTHASHFGVSDDICNQAICPIISFQEYSSIVFTIAFLNS